MYYFNYPIYLFYTLETLKWGNCILRLFITNNIVYIFINERYL